MYEDMNIEQPVAVFPAAMLDEHGCERGDQEGAEPRPADGHPGGQGPLGGEVQPRPHHRGDVHQAEAQPAQNTVGEGQDRQALGEGRQEESQGSQQPARDAHQPGGHDNMMEKDEEADGPHPEFVNGGSNDRANQHVEASENTANKSDDSWTYKSYYILA